MVLTLWESLGNARVGDDGLGMVLGTRLIDGRTDFFGRKIERMDKMVDGVVWGVRNYQCNWLFISQSDFVNRFYRMGADSFYHNGLIDGIFLAGL